MPSKHTKVSPNDPGKVKHIDVIEQVGHAWVPHIVAYASNPKTRISDGAFRVYVLLIGYQQQHSSSWYSVKSLGKEMHRSRAAVSRFLKELLDHKLISRRRRFNGSSYTYVLRLPKEYRDFARQVMRERDTKRQQATLDDTCIKNETLEQTCEGIKNETPELSKMIPHSSQKRDNDGIKNDTLRTTNEVQLSKKNKGSTTTAGTVAVADRLSPERPEGLVNHYASLMNAEFGIELKTARQLAQLSHVTEDYLRDWSEYAKQNVEQNIKKGRSILGAGYFVKRIRAGDPSPVRGARGSE